MHSRRCKRNRPHLALTGESHGLSRVAAGGLGFLCRYHREIREPLMLPQGSQVSIRVASESAGVLWIHSRGIMPQFPWKGESQGVSLVAAGSVGSLLCHGDLRDPLMLFLGSQESFQVVRGLSGFLSSWCRGQGPHLELKWEPQQDKYFFPCCNLFFFSV